MPEYQPVDLSQTQVDNFNVWCLDSRFDDAYRHVSQNVYGIKKADGVRWAAPSKAIAEGEVLSQIQFAYEKHGIKQVDIFDHIDCGGFGGLEAFGGDERTEAEEHFRYLKLAKEVISQAIPELKVRGHLLGTHHEIIMPMTHTFDTPIAQEIEAYREHQN